jgi:hypothetical protein
MLGHASARDGSARLGARIRRLIVVPASAPAVPKPAPPTPIALEPSAPLPWGSGETMTFAIRLAGVEGARGALSVGVPSRHRAERRLKLRGLAETVPFFSTIRRMREEVVTVIDLGAGLRPLRSDSDRTLAGKRRKIDASFGPPIQQRIDRDGQVTRRARTLSAPVYDALSALYALRAAVLPASSRLVLHVLAGPHLYRAEIRVAGRERVVVSGKPRDALRLDGIAQEIEDNGAPAFGERPRRFRLWLGVDRWRLPLRIVGDTKLGDVEATLSGHRPARVPLAARAPRLAAAVP